MTGIRVLRGLVVLRSLHTYPMTNILKSLCLLLTRLLILQLMCSLTKELILKACFSNFLYGFKRTELCQKRDTALPVFLKFLSDCDNNARAVLGSRELPTTYKRSFSDRRPYTVDRWADSC